MSAREFRKAIDAIRKRGILLVYPHNNRKEPASIWSELHPRTEMRWEWNDEGDDRVARLWHLREELSRSGEVVYAKWYQGRATFFSKDLFRSLLVLLGSTTRDAQSGLGADARKILSTLREDSPLSTKQLKIATELRGKFFESTYERAMKELWSRLLIVGFGEVDEGAFPSLAVGATERIFESLWDEARETSREEALRIFDETIPKQSHFRKPLRSSKLQTASASPSRSD